MSGRNRYPFTATQWQELEHQALIFKYMASGIPIPPDLLFTIKRSYNLDSSSLASKLFPNHPQHVGWNCFQMGLGRKIDPEPGRCRRTDGKKWRCSKEAFPDSKYCERHMHRGKNRSRKPVEVLKSPSSSPLTTSSLTSQTPNSSSSFSSLSSDTQNRHDLHYAYYNNNTHILDHHLPMIYHHQPRTHHGLMGLSSQDSNTSLHFDSDWRNRYGDQERAFFCEEPAKGGFARVASSMNDSWQLTPVLTMSCSSSSSSKQHYLQLQSGSGDAQKQQQQQQQQQEQSRDQNFVKLERKQETKKTIHFFDEWPVKERDSSSSWPDLDDKSSNSGSVSTTQLSISIPSTNSSYDFPIFTSSRTTHNGD